MVRVQNQSTTCYKLIAACYLKHAANLLPRSQVLKVRNQKPEASQQELLVERWPTATALDSFGHATANGNDQLQTNHI